MLLAFQKKKIELVSDLGSETVVISYVRLLKILTVEQMLTSPIVPVMFPLVNIRSYHIHPYLHNVHYMYLFVHI